MTVQGFTLDPNNLTIRLQCTYGSREERSWCECAELADAKLWEEAKSKLDEYYDACGGFVRNNSRDAMLTAKIVIGLATSKLSYDRNLYDNACKTLSFAMGQDDGSDTYKISDMVEDLSTGQIQSLVKHTYFGKASTATLVECARLLIRLFTIADEYDLDIAYYQDCSHDRLHWIIDELLERDEAAKGEARKFIDKVLSLSHSDFFIGMATEWTEKIATMYY